MPIELSGNWKILQQTIKHPSSATSSSKRTTPFVEKQDNPTAKRRRKDGSMATSCTPSTRKKSLNKYNTEYVDTKVKASPGAISDPASSSSAPPTVWAEDNEVSTKDLFRAYGTEPMEAFTTSDTINCGLVSNVEIGKYLGIDCEMVGVGSNSRSVLARVSIVNFHGILVYDSYVKPNEYVTDWRTKVSGISSREMIAARSFNVVQQEIATLLKNRIIVGHSVHNDLAVMQLSHSKHNIRDTSKFTVFRKYTNGRTPSLKLLAREILGLEIQNGSHSSIEDARATMLIFRRYKNEFDTAHIKSHSKSQTSKTGSNSRNKSKSSKR
ncbi:Bgt-3371 [Blumeria graminis f. sp. tritici]|uniref:RNA exonuclease 4 n=2 Tax=Blumeria graminis f. sp. tritici TaxID=62690 RepID=A0A381L5G5_BLUGR|nr:RNA exonuclease [Blumeria graminis f. sp. tritici 96224]VDB89658.1 Bgt-3371 [Blumeria graminis f. sp. tritici]